jgi:hypothetical protein
MKMSETPRNIRVAPRSELALLIRDADRASSPLIVDTGETVYPLRVDSKEKAEPKSRRLKSRLLSFAGVCSDLDADELLERLDRARHASPPSPAVRP